MGPLPNPAQVDDIDESGRIRGLWLGALGWLVFSGVAVAVRGVRWDENYEFSQNILGWMAYPEGHPLFLYPRGAFSLQTYSTAALLYLFHSAGIVNGIRNLLFMAATVLPPFLLGALFSRRALAGHIAAVLILLGIHLEFDSSYPQFIWPDMFSNGHIGTAYALITLFCLLAGRWRTGFFLVGLMPCIHLGQLPPVLFVALWTAFLLHREGERGALKQAGAFAALGLGCTAAFWAVQRGFVMPPASTPPYGTDAEVFPIWAGYTAALDTHRTIPQGPCHLALAALLLLSGGFALRKDEPSRPWRLTFLYALCIAGLVWGTALLHMALGASIPTLFLRWMPYRLLNHAPLLLVAVLVGLSGREPRTKHLRGLDIVLVALLAYGLLHPLVARLAGEALYARYLRPSVGLLFFLIGAGVAAWARLEESTGRRWVLGCAWAAWLLMVAAIHQFGAACIVLGYATGWFAESLARPTTPRLTRRFGYTALCGSLCLCILISLLLAHARLRAQLPVPGFRREIAETLAVRDPEALIVGPPFQLLLQAHTGHPVMTDMAVPTWMGYMPAITPTVGRIYAEVYGIDFVRLAEPGVRREMPPWTKVWAHRSRDEWQALAKSYGFRYVVGPRTVPLDLPPLLEGTDETLYEAVAPGGAPASDDG